MQAILAAITFIETFCSMYILSNIVLAVLGLSASRKQKAIFAFIIGPVLYSTPIYVFYFLTGAAAFSHMSLMFFITPNPVYGLIYYFFSKKIFGFSPVRSIKMVSYVYIFGITTKTLSRIVGAICYVQNEPSYNFFKDALQQITYFIIFFIICRIVMYLIKRGYISFHFADNMFFNKKKDLSLFFLKASIAFAIRFILPLIIENQAIAFILSFGILILFILINIWLDAIAYHRQTISNHEVHISALSDGLEELRGIKHDFNNILHTYSGYLELKEYERLEKYHESLVSVFSHAGTAVELAQKMQENPAVVTLLINKLEYAESMNINMRISIRCELDNLYIDTVDISRILACLLDNAVEAAHDSQQRRVNVTMESKAKGSKLIIITNSTACAIDPNVILNSGTTKHGHAGIGLSIVRKTLAKYGNCTFQMKYYDHELSVYVELKEAL